MTTIFSEVCYRDIRHYESHSNLDDLVFWVYHLVEHDIEFERYLGKERDHGWVFTIRMSTEIYPTLSCEFISYTTEVLSFTGWFVVQRN